MTLRPGDGNKKSSTPSKLDYPNKFVSELFIIQCKLLQLRGLDSFPAELHCKLRNVRSLTIRNRSSAIHVHLIKQTVDIQVRNGRVCTLENVTQLRFINSSITVHIKSLQKNQAHVLPRALSIRQKTFRFGLPEIYSGEWNSNV